MLVAELTKTIHEDYFGITSVHPLGLHLIATGTKSRALKEKSFPCLSQSLLALR
jgi:hypothetical protein